MGGKTKIGITGELVKSIFSRNKSFGAHEHNNGRGDIVEKRRWRSTVRSYLCGDEFNSVLAEEDSASIKDSNATFEISQPLDSVLAHEGSASVKPLDSALADEDSASVKSSEATVTQPVMKEEIDKEEEGQSEATESHIPKKQSNSVSRLFKEDDAALIIQYAFRSFLARRRNEEAEDKDFKQETSLGNETPSRESLATSIEVETGNSVKAFSVEVENLPAQHRLHQQPRTQILRIKDGWDDSTVSSNISKMRIQQRLEAMTRRERALAYAFSQQLRICSKTRRTGCNESEPSMGWSWLERWMATRVPESVAVENSAYNQPEMAKRNPRLVIRKKLLDGAGEVESCGSNEVSVQFDSVSVTAPDDKDCRRQAKDRLKATRNISKRKTAPSCQVQRECAKQMQPAKRDLERDTQKAKTAKKANTQQNGKKETKFRDAQT